MAGAAIGCRDDDRSELKQPQRKLPIRSGRSMTHGRAAWAFVRDEVSDVQGRVS
jgi:hypothetical protein